MLSVPPGWPERVRPPGAPGWEVTAGAWLLDICPPEYRSYPVLRHHVAVLARFAALHIKGAQMAVDVGLSEARGALREVAEAVAAPLGWDSARVDEEIATTTEALRTAHRVDLAEAGVARI